MAIAIRAKQSLTRRHLLVRSASTVALAALGGLARPYLSRAADRPQITCGLQSGDVSADSAAIWARADRPARMKVECAGVESFKTIIGSASAEALPEHDFTAKVLLQGLPPGDAVRHPVRAASSGWRSGIAKQRYPDGKWRSDRLGSTWPISLVLTAHTIDCDAQGQG